MKEFIKIMVWDQKNLLLSPFLLKMNNIRLWNYYSHNTKNMPLGIAFRASRAGTLKGCPNPAFLKQWGTTL